MKVGKWNIMMLLVTMMEISCVFVVHDKGTRGSLSSSDSSNAYSFKKDSVKENIAKDSTVTEIITGKTINTRTIKPGEVVEFAESLIGVPYRYGSTDPKIGFDCSGFITYVFKHFGIEVPRSSIDFTLVGKEVSAGQAMRGDLILFTGTDSTERFVGHMGLVVSNENGILNFIHSTSGKKMGVTITPLNSYYKGRFMKTIRIFPQDN
jgi:cell wall-associated NlpC family hydrolase